MADFQVTGVLEGFKTLETAMVVTVSELRLGYKKKNGTQVNEQVLTWTIVFKPYFKKYISNNFYSGMLVQVKGMVFPFKKVGGEEYVDGCTVIGQTINVATHQKNVRKEKQILRQSQAHNNTTPNLEDFMLSDF